MECCLTHESLNKTNKLFKIVDARTSIENFIGVCLSQTENMPGSKISKCSKEWQFCSSFYTFGIKRGDIRKEREQKIPLWEIKEVETAMWGNPYDRIKSKMEKYASFTLVGKR